MSSASLCIRELESTDSIEELTDLLHRAYAPLGAMGLNFTRVDQSTDVTMDRISQGICFVATACTRMIGTILVCPAHSNSLCSYYNEPGVATVHQFAVEPSIQKTGIGSALLSKAETWAKENGFVEVALDTAEPAIKLINYYARRGYRQIGTVQWPGKRYRSVVMSKTINPSGKSSANPADLGESCF